jgi:Zn-finger protein
MKNSYKFFSNKDCQYYPCKKSENLNCLFCFCPLYSYDCKGDFEILDNGLKDCSKCLRPHGEDGHKFIVNSIMNFQAKK